MKYNIDVKVSPGMLTVIIDIPIPEVGKINFGRVMSIAWGIIRAIKAKKVPRG